MIKIVLKDNGFECYNHADNYVCARVSTVAQFSRKLLDFSIDDERFSNGVSTLSIESNEYSRHILEKTHEAFIDLKGLYPNIIKLEDKRNAKND